MISDTSGGQETAARLLFQRGLEHHRRGNLAQAQRAYRQALELQARHFDALHLLGVVAYQGKDPAQARDLIGRAIAIDPNVSAAHGNLGNALRDLGEYTAAIVSYDRALSLKPDDAVTHSNRGNALADLGQFERALASYDAAVALDPAYSEGHNNRGNALRALARYEAALASFDRAIAINPNSADAYVNRGNTLQDQARHAEAIASYGQAIARAPALACAYRQRGVSLARLRDPAAALADYDMAIRLAPRDADAYNSRGNAQRVLKNFPAALADYAAAIELDPACREAHFNRGTVFDDLKDFAAAARSYESVLALQADYPYAAGLRLHAQRQVCEWQRAIARAEELERLVLSNRKAAMPFHGVALMDSPRAQRAAAEIWIRDRHPALDDLPPFGDRGAGERIRLGYFSSDFHDHATSHLLAGLLERHDRRRFEVVGFSFGAATHDETSKRIAGAFDRFLDVRDFSDKEITLLSRQSNIDIAIDLKGFTGDNRIDVFARRAAPVQVSYLGYPGTSGAGYIDYLIADSTLIPAHARGHYSEKIIYLPHSYQANDATRRISSRLFSRAELGLPDSGFVFCCFNNNYKITPESFSGWMRILGRVGGSVLWLLEDNATAAFNLRKEAAAQGVSPSRLIFAQRMPSAEHLARHRAADLFLDTAPYNAHTTASDALWAELPVLTRIANSFAGRVASSLLRAIQLPELIVSSQQEYEDLAVRLAQDPAALAAVRHKLSANRKATPLFDTALFAAHLEDAYMQIFERHQARLPPEHIHAR